MNGMEEPLSSEEPRPFTRRRLVLAAALILLLILAIFLPPLINLGHYRRSITASMSAALGRPVSVGSMQLRLLPTPGIAMTDLTVEEDPAFGYEPALHANSVVASLRLTSLWRGRLEVSRISLDEANLNLVRNSAGQWSIGSVLLRAAQIPNAPTAERHPGTYLRFPYIEASNARIDFKDGVEKKPFSLMNAEFSMWQASGGEWQLRLEAQPVRTDLELHLSDTGTLRVDGSLRRAADLNAMPVNLRADWSGAQLGQASRLIAGFDSGWRGDLDATATIRGTAGDLQLQSRVRVGNLRRQEFQPAAAVDVDATCRSEYRHVEKSLENITCFWPIAGGHLLLTGSVHGIAPADANLQLEINQIPASFPVTVLGLMRPHAQNVVAAGKVNGSFRLITGEAGSLAGEATATGVSMSYSGGSLALPALHFVTQQPLAPRKGKWAARSAPAENAILLQAFPILLGEPQPLVADARFTRAGFELHLAGEAALGRLMSAGANFGLLENAVAAVGPKGRATLNTTTAGNWMPPLAGGSTGIGTSGTVQVEEVELRPAFLHAPVEVESAEVDLTPQQISWENAAFRYQGMAMHGSIQFPAVCNQAGPCPATFTLRPGALNAAAMETDLGGGAKSGFLGQFLANALGNGSNSAWPPLQGTIQCDTLELGRLALHNATVAVAVDGRKLTIDSLDGVTLGGTLHASGEMTIESGAPRWNLDVRLTGAQASEIAGLFREHWGTGLVSGEANLSLSGYRTADLASSASGDFGFTWQNGGLAPLENVTTLPLQHFGRWTAKGTISQGTLTLASSGVSRSGRTNLVSGEIGFDRHLDLTVETRRGRVRVRGTLARPVVAAGAP